MGILPSQPTQPGPQPPVVGAPANAPVKKTRRSPGSIYSLAARQRRIQQQYANLHHPPNPEDIWICEFCEYEAIFGRPPEALIRQYEIKDRKERRRLAEKRRLLEKAKMKGRKGKKATKNAAKHAATTQQPAHAPTEPVPMDGHRSHPDDYVGPEYDDEAIPVPSPTPPQHNAVKTPAPLPTASQSPSSIRPVQHKGVPGGGGTSRTS